MTVAAYRKIAGLIDQPLHLGITEAGGFRSGAVKSAVGLGMLLMDGICATIRVSLAADPIQEIKVGFDILKSLRLRAKGINFIACPSCSRQNFDVVQTMNELEERVNERTRDLLIEKENGEKASNAKTEFLSSMSHELRTPMDAILGFAQILEHDVAHQQMDLVKDNVDEILVAGRHLLELVNDVLDLAKIETGKYVLDLKEIIVSRAIKDVVSLLSVLTSKNNIKISCDFEGNDDLSVMVDLRSFRQALINIITNAIKYNKENGEVKIFIRKKDNICQISITDEGEGIAKENFEKIFEPFERVSNRTNIEGSGVGLSITKNLIEIMDGKLTVESELGVGSTFIISFQAAN